MQRKNTVVIVFFAALFLPVLITGCGSSGSVQVSDPAEGKAGSLPAGGEEGTRQPASEKPGGPAYTGSGGKGLSIAVLEPAGNNIPETEKWVLALIQGSLTGDFQKYSAMTVTDRQNLDAVLGEQTLNASGNFSDEDYISMGRLTSARYILAGTLTKLPAGYMLDLGVTDAESGERKASYPSKLCAPADVLNLKAVKEAADELLTQLGVELTGAGRQRLLAVDAAGAGAETALAQGVVAQRGGSVVEAMTRYHEAVSLDSGLSEAASRLSAMTKEVQNGGLGAQVRGDMERRNAWKKLLEDARDYFLEHPYIDIVYNTRPEQGKTNYDTGETSLAFNVWAVPNAGFETLKDIQAALKEIGLQKVAEWGLIPLDDSILKSRCLFFEAELLDETGAFLDNSSSDAWGRGRSVHIETEYRGPKVYIYTQSRPIFFQHIKTAELGETVRLQFTSVKSSEVNRLNSFVPVGGNIIENVRIIPTDKTFEEYFNDTAFRRQKVFMNNDGRGDFAYFPAPYILSDSLKY